MTFRANEGAGRHGWLRLTPAYGVRLVRERLAALPPGSVVTDPFSGTGTTPLAAAEAGHLGQSVDVNPFLVWLGTVKTRHYTPAVLRAAADAACEVAAEAAPARSSDARSSDALWQPPIFRIERWWGAGDLRALKALRAAIDPHGGQVRDLLDLAFCRAVIARSAAAFNHQSMSFAAARGAARPSDPGSYQATVEVFARAAAEIVGTAGEGLTGSARVVRGDSREPYSGLRECDLVLTSPPYVNRMSYIREVRPYMYWLRFLDAAAEAGEMDWKAIGGTWGTATSKLATWRPQGPTPVEDALDAVCGRIAADGGKSGPLLATYVRKYHHDMWAHLRQVTEVVKDGGRVCYIVGNSVFSGHEVPAQQWIAAMLREAGYRRVEVEAIRKRNSNRALFEFDVRAVKPPRR